MRPTTIFIIAPLFIVSACGDGSGKKDDSGTSAVPDLTERLSEGEVRAGSNLPLRQSLRKIGYCGGARVVFLAASVTACGDDKQRRDDEDGRGSHT